MHFDDVIVINRPREEVWAFITDLFNSPRVHRGSLEWRPTSPGPVGVGSTAQGRMVILGIETRLNLRIVEWDPPHSWLVTMTGRPVRSYVDRVTMELVGEATRVSRSTEFDPHPALKLLGLFYTPLFRRQQRAVFQNAKRILETKAP